MNKSKRKGTAFETDVVNFLRSEGLEAVRLAQTGVNDQGDIVAAAPGGMPFVLEAKNEQRIALASYTDEAVIEAVHYGMAHRTSAFPAAVIKRRGRGTEAAYAVMPLYEFVKLISTQTQSSVRSTR